MAVHAVLKSLDFDPEPSELPADPASFCTHATMYVGPPDSAGYETFQLTVCSPEWLAAQTREVGILHARHHLLVDFESFDQRRLRTWLEKLVSGISDASWREVGEKVGRLGYWEFEDYQD